MDKTTGLRDGRTHEAGEQNLPFSGTAGTPCATLFLTPYSLLLTTYN